MQQQMRAFECLFYQLIEAAPMPVVRRKRDEIVPPNCAYQRRGNGLQVVDMA